MRKKIVLPVIFALFAACSSPLLEWIEAETGIAPYAFSGKGITYFSFTGDPSETDTIREKPSGVSGITPITVVLPAGSPVTNLRPAIQYIGKSISPGSGEPQNFSSPVTYRVTAEDNSWRDYEVQVIVKTPASAELLWFDLELPGGTYLAEGAVTQTFTGGTVTLHVPSKTDRSFLTAKIVQTGKTLTAPNAFGGATYSGTTISLAGNFSNPVIYTVRAEDNSTKTYTVTVTEDKSGDTGIFKFEVTKADNSPILNSHVVIGTVPRGDGKIPIVIQVPYGTDETAMRARITLSDSTSTITPLSGPSLAGSSPGPFTGIITFGPSNNQEAVYTVTAENGATQDYVAVVSEGPQYYYVNGISGRDTWPDYYNGGSESHPFKTLAYAVRKAAQDGIEKVLIMGDLTTANGGAPGDSAFAIDLSQITNKKVTVASSDPGVTRTLTAGSPQRVLGISGGADLTFQNIKVTGGYTAGNGGGIYVGGNSKVDFSGNITGNRAGSGGGVYVEAGTNPSDSSSFTLTSGTITGNTATGTNTAPSTMGGGGGVYIKGNANFYLKTGGTISGNTADGGSGGGVLVNGNVDGSTEYGLFMEDNSRIINNTSTSATYPHGGGGVYVAQGVFEMAGGEVTDNTATNRQGGGVFVHWANSPTLTARFTASGDSVITGNYGVGSSKAICNRGITELQDTATADYVYIWDYGDPAVPSQSFTLANSTKITVGIALARSNDKTTANKNFITLVAGYTPSLNPIIIDLESHTENGSFAGTLEPDWLNEKLIEGANPTLTTMLNYLILNSFTGAGPTMNGLYNNYKIAIAGTTGTFVNK
ncbi:MAG: hypothetical protein LBP60_07760 [Spirochaetaceae bacterium]|jgi:hypothetical protein|nr:hypothetical protein [Spirochaetaceae bacterium]